MEYCWEKSCYFFWKSNLSTRSVCGTSLSVIFTIQFICCFYFMSLFNSSLEKSTPKSDGPATRVVNHGLMMTAAVISSWQLDVLPGLLEGSALCVEIDAPFTPQNLFFSISFFLLFSLASVMSISIFMLYSFTRLCSDLWMVVTSRYITST